MKPKDRELIDAFFHIDQALQHLRIIKAFHHRNLSRNQHYDFNHAYDCLDRSYTLVYNILKSCKSKPLSPQFDIDLDNEDIPF